MSLKKKPMNGMKDILPEEMRVREYLSKEIREVYRSYGFSSVETPAVEHIENLTSKQGGDNEKLIFRIMKRGEKLRIDEKATEDSLADSGLRYDLTLPLARFYSNNENNLPSPFKALQMGPVWRADRPQRGRFRQFMQCDIDILGEESILAEMELLEAATTLLRRIGFGEFTVRMNDRRLLSLMAEEAGFEASETEGVFITLDKMDKIGLDGVREELLQNTGKEEAVKKYLSFFETIEESPDPLEALSSLLPKEEAKSWVADLALLKANLDSLSDGKSFAVFDPTLVRGMGYYTGPIFEISMPGFSGSVAGGGRYDGMIGRFTGQNTPACGFSIGFERIITIWMEEGREIPGESKKLLLLTEKKLSGELLRKVLAFAREKRAEGYTVSVNKMKKNKRFQKEQMEKEGYTECLEFYADSGEKLLEELRKGE